MPSEDKRKYIRLNSVFPVGMELEDISGKLEFCQAFTQNVSEGGLCVTAFNINETWVDKLLFDKAILNLTINIPLRRAAVSAKARVSWIKEIPDTKPVKWQIGVKYIQISKKDRKRLIYFSRKISLLPKLAAAALIILLLISGVFFVKNIKLQLANKAMLQDLISLNKEKDRIIKQFEMLEKGKQNLENQLQDNREVVMLMENRMREIEESKVLNVLDNEKMFSEKEQILEILQVEKDMLQQQLRITLKNNKQLMLQIAKTFQDEEALQTELKSVENKKAELIDRTTELLYNWVMLNQNKHTGLITSFDSDQTLTDFAFTYDQALAALNFINFKEYTKAAKIFDFYLHQAQKNNGGYFNAYDVKNGKVLEYTVHTGPNVVFGVAVLWYTKITGDQTYINIARNIARFVIDLQDSDGGVRGGPNIIWTSTEHNIDAYAFLKLFAEIDRRERYLSSARDIENWLVNVAYNKKHFRFNRGREDIAIATDTMALAISAIGPEKLLEMGVNLEALVNCVESNCKVDVLFDTQHQRQIRVSGFDFSNPSSLGRKGIISTEWTAQMIIAYQVLGDFYLRDGQVAAAKNYAQKAKFYLSQLEKMIMLRPLWKNKQGGGLPYASDSRVNTGHGWLTPEVSAISISGTIYNLFARKNYNPFRM
ncbi:MAG: PilZ domain-containing protein [Candidatus Omnitrophota bacterium]